MRLVVQLCLEFRNLQQGFTRFSSVFNESWSLSRMRRRCSSPTRFCKTAMNRLAAWRLSEIVTGSVKKFGFGLHGELGLLSGLAQSALVVLEGLQKLNLPSDIGQRADMAAKATFRIELWYGINQDPERAAIGPADLHFSDIGSLLLYGSFAVAHYLRVCPRYQYLAPASPPDLLEGEPCQPDKSGVDV